MQTEIEAKFLNITHDDMRARLHELGAVCQQPLRLMRRKNYDFRDARLESQGGWVRLRDQGDKVTLAYKQLQDRSLHGTKEVEVTVSDFAQTDALLAAIGLQAGSYQETRRESWLLGDIQIELDEWPWIQPFLEIEGPTEAVVRDMATQLGLDWANALHGSVEVAYQAEYDATDEEIDHIDTITFEHEVPAWLEAKRRETP